MFDTRISIVVSEDLATRRKLNVVAFLTSGVVGANVGLIGEAYEDAAGMTWRAARKHSMLAVGTLLW